MAKTMRRRLRERILSKTGIAISDVNMKKLTLVIAQGICRILAREGHISLDKLGSLEYEVLATKEVRFADGLPVMMPIKSKFHWRPGEECREIIRNRRSKKLEFKEDDLVDVYEGLRGFGDSVEKDKEDENK